MKKMVLLTGRLITFEDARLVLFDMTLERARVAILVV